MSSWRISGFLHIPEITTSPLLAGVGFDGLSDFRVEPEIGLKVSN